MNPSTLVPCAIILAHIKYVVTPQDFEKGIKDSNPSLSAGTCRDDSDKVFLCRYELFLHGQQRYVQIDGQLLFRIAECDIECRCNFHLDIGLDLCLDIGCSIFALVVVETDDFNRLVDYANEGFIATLDSLD